MQPETENKAHDLNDQPNKVERHRLPKGNRDGYEVHRAALERGLNIRLLPRQVMEVTIPGDPRSTKGFVHGVPQETTLAGATYAQDLRMRRAMLMKAGFTVPRGATFSVGRSRVLGRKFADRIGYPVVVKPAVGENTIEVQTGIKNKRQFNQAIEYLYTPPRERKQFTRSAYALTELREPGKVNGKLVAPPGYRFLVEKQEQGQYLRFLIINGTIQNVLYCPDGPWKTRPHLVQDVTNETHISLKETARQASRVIPGLQVVTVDLIATDYTTKTSIEDAKIVEFSERPWLSVQLKKSPELAAKMASRILMATFPQAEDLTSQDRVLAAILIGGAVDPIALLEALGTKFHELDIESDLKESDHTLGQIRGTVSGRPTDLAWVFERLLDKGINNQRAMLVEQTVL